jgi:hypothetical protein
MASATLEDVQSLHAVDFVLSQLWLLGEAMAMPTQVVIVAMLFPREQEAVITVLHPWYSQAEDASNLV